MALTNGAGLNITGALRKGLRYFFTEQLMSGFSGGLNLRDAPTELKPTESPNCWNVTLDERGGVVKRLGYIRWDIVSAPNLIKDSYYSTLTGLLFWFSNSDGGLYRDSGDGNLTLSHTFTSNVRVTLVDFAGAVYLSHPIDGLYSSTDGITWTVVSKGAHTTKIPAGALACVWQNKLWISGDPSHKNRVWFCAAGDATDWDSADGGGSVDIREKDDADVIALAGGAGADLQTQPGLFVFKRDSTYRIYDSTTGAYLTVDPAIGCASKNSVVGMYGELVFLGRRGIYMTRKETAVVPVAEQLLPLWDPASLDDTTMDNWCAGYQGDRVYFSMTRQGSSINNIALEFAPLYGWIVPGSNAMGCYQTRTGTAGEILIAADPNNPGRLYQMNNGGSDAGTDITSWFETRWFQVSSGHNARMNLLRLLVRGDVLTLTVWADFKFAVQFDQDITPTNDGMIWGTSKWGAADWGGQAAENYLDVHPHVIGRAFKIRIDESSSLTFQVPKPLPGFGNGALTVETGATAGGWALYAVDGQYAPLGLS